MMTDDDSELRRLAEEGRAKIQASGVGTMHGMWDAVFDAEAILKGRPSILARDRVAEMLRKFLAT